MNKLSLKYKAIKDIRERRRAFVLDVAGFYNLNNRSVGPNTCLYSAGPNSPGCAIGRCLGASTAARFDLQGIAKSSNGGSGIFNHIHPKAYLWKRVPVWMREMDPEFLRDVQRLHDDGSYWTEKGLSSGGRAMVDWILAVYCS
jgi:hypothetical protein